MFTTTESESLPYFFQLNKERIFNWRSVDFIFNSPYFFVDYIVEEDGAKFTQSKIIGSASDLVQFCDGIKSELKQVAVLAPPQSNGKNKWELIDLVEILHVEFDTDNSPTTIYVASDGRKFSDFSNSVDLCNAIKMRSIFAM